MTQIACIVEGHGDIDAVPVVVRRIAQEFNPSLAIYLNHVFRVPRSRLIKESELERAVEFAARRVGLTGGILIVLDADDECPATLGPELLRRARQVRPGLPIRVVLAKREFEAWFLAAAESLQGRRGLSQTLQGPSDPESVRGAKEWLTARMAGERHYVETLDQSALAAVFDFTRARRAQSFDKFFRDVLALLQSFHEGS
jgi:hypothetical protein